MTPVNWRWWLAKTSNLARLAEITTNAHGKKLNLMLNSPGTAEFWMHLEDDKVKYVEEGATSLICYRNNKPIWSGPIFKAIDNTDNQNNSTCQITCNGWYDLLNHRIVHTGKEWQEMAVRASGREIVKVNPPASSVEALEKFIKKHNIWPVSAEEKAKKKEYDLKEIILKEDLKSIREKEPKTYKEEQKYKEEEREIEIKLSTLKKEEEQEPLSAEEKEEKTEAENEINRAFTLESNKIESQYEEVQSSKFYNPIATESSQQLYYGRLEEPFGIPRNEIAVDLINRANIDVPTGVTIGLNPEVSSLNFTVPQFHPVGELITQLTSIEDGFDFAIDPLTRKFNIYYNEVKANTTIYGLGQDRGEKIRFTFPGNCILANRSTELGKMQNRTEAVGPYGVGKSESISSIAEYGVLFEKSENLTDVTNINILTAYASAQTAALEKPFRILTFNPRGVNNSESYSVPRPFEDYEIGDIVYAKVQKGPRFQVGVPNLQPVRIFGMNVEISDTGTEKITGIQTVYSQ